jgi:hypothetical protein
MERSWRVHCVVVWAILVSVCAATDPPVKLDPLCVHVLVDRSHEWLFAYDDLGDRILPPSGFQVVLCDASLDSTLKLSKFDVVMIQQTSTTIEFSKDEIALLKHYVQEGGNLLLVGRPDRPIALVAAAFALRMLPGPGSPPLLAVRWLREKHGADLMANIAQIPFLVQPSRNAEVLLADSQIRSVAVLARIGKGQILLFADDGTYWNFCGQRDENMRVPNMGLTAALFKCLVPEKHPTPPAPPASRVFGELNTEIGGLHVRWSKPLAQRAQIMVAVLPKVAAAVARRNGGLPPTDLLEINIIATGSGGWASGRAIGVQCDGPLGANVALITHELTHCWEGPLTGVFGEGWASLMGMRVAAELGMTETAIQQRRSFQEQFLKVDPTMHALDITRSEKDQAIFGACEGKAMWMIEQLEDRFGTDFMQRFLELRHALKGNDPLEFDDVFYYFILAAGQDLSTWYRELGISYQPPTPLSPEIIRERLDEYRARVAQWNRTHGANIGKERKGESNKRLRTKASASQNPRRQSVERDEIPGQQMVAPMGK